ncbi:MAG: membrane protein insertase YidC [Pseudomonadota bacterium]
MNDNTKNTILAVVLSIIVLIGWQALYIAPKLEEERRIAEATAEREITQNTQPQTSQSGQAGQAGVIPSEGLTAPAGGSETQATVSRDAALNETSRVTIETELLLGSINLLGARIDDLKLRNYRETIDPESPLITLLSPRGSDAAYFAEFGYLETASSGKVPGPQTQWQTDDKDLAANGSVTLSWTNEKDIRFERTISLDDAYMFTVSDRVINETGGSVDLTPYGRIARFGTPETQNIFVLHEGLIGMLGEEEGLQEIDYDDLQDEKEISQGRVDQGWLGMTDKYWATALIPTTSFKPTFSYHDRGSALYQTDFVGEASVISDGQTGEFTHRLFAGAKKSALIDQYETELGVYKFELMIDWGWFYFITKPLFWLLNWLFGIVGNFGVAILIATVIVKALFFYFANLSYASMAKMKKVQPEMMEIRERHSEDKMKQQQEMMALYKREKINPAAGCWPILIQIPVFFALYKVLFVTIEMRHAPFFGWIQDLAAPDPTSIFNLFGLLPFEVGGLFLVGVWPIIMGVTMFMQMQMNPTPPDPTQAMIFKWMPLVFTFMLATFPAGLVIYWAWNNFLSILQQGFIMRRHGTKIELFDNLKGIFKRKSTDASKETTAKPVSGEKKSENNKSKAKNKRSPKK